MGLFHRNLCLSMLRLCDRKETEIAGANQITKHKRNFPAVVTFMYLKRYILYTLDSYTNVLTLNKPAPRNIEVLAQYFMILIGREEEERREEENTYLKT